MKEATPENAELQTACQLPGHWLKQKSQNIEAFCHNHYCELLHIDLLTIIIITK